MTSDYCERQVNSNGNPNIPTQREIPTISENISNIARLGNRLGMSRLRTIHLDGFNAPTPPNSPVEGLVFDRLLSPLNESDQENLSPILSPTSFLSCNQFPVQLQEFKSFAFPQSITFLSLLEQELLKIQEKFYSKDGEECMSSADLGAVWKRIDYLENSIIALREQEQAGR
jgi:hypothetical protein